MSAWQTLQAATHVPLLLQSHGEQATITPKGGTPASAMILIDRREIAPAEWDGAAPQYSYVVMIPRSSLPALTVNGDTVAFKRRLGDAADTTFVVKELIGQSGGFWVLGVG